MEEKINKINMTDKKLLLIDICAKIPFNLIVHVKNDFDEYDGIVTSVKGEYFLILADGVESTRHINEITPYYRTIENMTIDEIKLFKSIAEEIKTSNSIFTFNKLFRFLNSHYIDFNGFIDKGLALEASKDLYFIND